MQNHQIVLPIYTTFEESNDPCVRGAELKVDGGRKADTPTSVTEAKSRLRMKEIVGIPNKGKEGLGLNPRKYYSSSEKDERRTMIVDSVREAEEDRRRVKMVSLAKQGAHARWDGKFQKEIEPQRNNQQIGDQPQVPCKISL